ncbi:MAG: histidine kinase, partial [Gammaproteobacteria bacterium]|nr:histidine kinase [Gammaproteobacteria bacterium]
KKQYDFKTIKIVKEYAEVIPSVPCEDVKIQQVLLNILRNGAQAMQEAKVDNPTFTLRTYHKPEHGMVCIEIEDNGPGMNETIRKRIFEPFFTTKPVGLGTGLGLSVSYFIINENHNGKISVESEQGKGTRFVICLPSEGKGVQP